MCLGFNGRFGEYCSNTCKGTPGTPGIPCTSPIHMPCQPHPSKIPEHGSDPEYIDPSTGKKVDQAAPNYGVFTTKNFTCKRPECPCLSTWNAAENEFCCKACKNGIPCKTSACTGTTVAAVGVHWTVFHGTTLTAATGISTTGFRPTVAEWGELGEAVYATCVRPGTAKKDAEDKINDEIGKAKRFAHDKAKKSTPQDVPVLIICVICFDKVEIRDGSDPEGWEIDPINGDAANSRTIGRASQWKLKDCQACFTSKTDGVRKPFFKSPNTELCFKPSMTVQQMRIIRLDKEGKCPKNRACTSDCPCMK
jgi:hypothetical protein